MIYEYSREKNIAEQVFYIKKEYAGFDVGFNHLQLKAIGEMQPTARSGKYEVEVKYRLHKPPEIRIVKPKLIVNFNGDEIPHVYPGNQLCLYQPKYAEFKFSDYLSSTIFPWISLWLYHYEVWHMTGNWKGGGEHPVKLNRKKDKYEKTR